MAKSNFLVMMKAKPNERGRRSHLPLLCSVNKCEEDFLISYQGKEDKKRYCQEHAPMYAEQKPTELLTQVLERMGLLAA